MGPVSHYAPGVPFPRSLSPSVIASLLGLAACSGSSTPHTTSKFFVPPSGAGDVSSSTAAERYFPLVDGTVFNYATQNEARGNGVLIARVHRVDATHGDLVFPTGRKRFSYTPEGVRILPSGDFVLAAPVVRGATFRGQNGGRAVIEETSLVIDVKAGSFKDCVRVVEERGGDRRARYATTFCPDIGIVVLEAESGELYERAELVSAGPAVNIEDGVTIDPGAAPSQ